MAEKEYIEREAALEECDWYANEFCECEYAIMPLKGALENLPAADVRPVVRAAWQSWEQDTPPCKWYSCDYCGADMRPTSMSGANGGGKLMDELIKRLRQLAEEQMFDFERRPYLQAADAIEELQKLRWIPVTERLPEAERKSYWVCTDTGYQCECRWTNNEFGIGETDEWDWSIFDIPQYQKVVAWMPLPCPYETPKEE